MALSLLNYFVLDIPELRVPLMFADAFIVLTMGIYESKAKKQEEKVKLDEAHHKEEDKANERALHAANRDKNKQEKMVEKKVQNSKGPANFGRKHTIQQPDKNKKLR